MSRERAEFGVEGEGGGFAGLGVEGSDDCHIAVTPHNGGQNMDSVSLYTVIIGYENLSYVRNHIFS